MRPLIALVLFIALVSPPVFHVSAGPQDIPQPPSGPLSPDRIEEKLDGPIDARDIAAASGWATSSGIVDWLGPLAPLALSPFFGVTCLSGLALWGPDWATDNAVLGVAGPLRNETLFFIFLGLTVLTSVPRLTKVSKPFAQAVDRLETYAVIVILLVIKLVMTANASEDGGPVAMVHFGIVSMTVDTLVAIAMVVNVLVINSVKFFFEFLVWLTPVPFLDAVFEVCNKSLCAGLMAVYAYSPTIATGINLVLLLVAALILRWISRRVRFYRTMVLDPVLATLWSGFGMPKKPELIVFPKNALGPFKPKSRLRLSGDSSSGWKLSEASWWLPAKDHPLTASSSPKVRQGWVMHTIEFTGDDGTRQQLVFSKRYGATNLSRLLQQLGMDEDTADDVAQENMAAQFA